MGWRRWSLPKWVDNELGIRVAISWTREYSGRRCHGDFRDTLVTTCDRGIGAIGVHISNMPISDDRPEESGSVWRLTEVK